MQDYIQGSLEWKAMRKNHIMASDAPVILGVSPYGKTAHQLWQEKLGLSQEEKETSAMAYGKMMEDPARDAYQLYTGNIVKPEVVFHPSIKYMGASLDGLTENGDIAVEIKNTNLTNHEIAKKGHVPDGFYPQVQHQLACLGIEMMHYFSFYKGESALVEVPRDETFLEQLYARESQFWEKVLNLEEPDLTDKDFIKFDDEIWELNITKDWNVINSQLAILEKRKEEIKNAIISRANAHNSKGAYLRVERIIRKGNVDYKAIPELRGVDMNKYRKDPSVFWKITSQEVA